MDRARLESLRAEHQPVPLTSLDDGYHCGKCCGYNWPCEQSQILDLALRAEGYRKALEDCIEALNVEDNRLRRQYPDPDFAYMVQSLGERIGYGVVMTEASRLWFEKAGSGAFSVGHCIAIQESAWEAARAALEETR